MEVRRGINHPDYAREKFDVTLDETDLARLCREYGLDMDRLTVLQVHLLLEKEADRYCIVQSPKFGRAMEDAQQQHAQNREEFEKILDHIRADQGLCGSSS